MNKVSESLKKLGMHFLERCSPARSMQEPWPPPGHYYSPIPSEEDIDTAAANLRNAKQDIPGINLNTDQQLQLLGQLEQYYPEIPFSEEKTQHRRYFYENPYFSYQDSAYLYCLMRHLKPRAIIEVGSGFSSAAMLDIDELFLGKNTSFTFIEPDPERLKLLIRPEDEAAHVIVEKRVQDIDPELFSALRADDILFIDSSHVAKAGSDVTSILFNILPNLAEGVYIHLHDIRWPFEYPRSWYEEGRYWNEAYFLRAFLQYNSAFEIILFNAYIMHFYEDYFKQHLPLCLTGGGASMWLKKTQSGVCG